MSGQIDFSLQKLTVEPWELIMFGVSDSQKVFLERQETSKTMGSVNKNIHSNII